MSNRKLNKHLQHLHKQQGEAEKQFELEKRDFQIEKREFEQYKREQEIDVKVKYGELKSQESEMMVKMMQKMMQIQEIQHRTEIDNINTLNTVEKERMGIEMDNLQHLLSETERYHQETLEMIDIFNKNKLLEQEINHKHELESSDHDYRILEMENKKYETVMERVKNQIEYYKEEGALNSKQMELNNDMMDLVKKEADLTRKAAHLFKKELKEKEMEIEDKEAELDSEKRFYEKNNRELNAKLKWGEGYKDSLGYAIELQKELFGDKNK